MLTIEGATMPTGSNAVVVFALAVLAIIVVTVWLLVKIRRKKHASDAAIPAARPVAGRPPSVEPLVRH